LACKNILIAANIQNFKLFAERCHWHPISGIRQQMTNWYKKDRAHFFAINSMGTYVAWPNQMTTKGR
jgi:hypothetical protein